jgi:acid phosphatase (class B)
MQPVVFTSGPEKTRFIHDRKLSVYYGDSDSDITSARAAGARPVRIMRSANSTYQPLPKNGALGEDVLLNSTY